MIRRPLRHAVGVHLQNESDGIMLQCVKADCHSVLLEGAVVTYLAPSPRQVHFGLSN